MSDIPESWLSPSSPKEAKEIQYIMAKNVIEEDIAFTPRLIGGMDVSNNLYDPTQMIYASIVCLTFPQLQLIDKAEAAQKQTFPYIPGLLGFREAPALVQAFKNLKQKPDILMIDGHGLSHPRKLGIASHIGVLLDIPTIGVAKSILIGQPATALAPEVGSQVPLIWKGETVGFLLRAKARTNPLIISVGHKVSLNTALDLVKSTLKGYRLPEPTRNAHLAANAFRKQNLSAD